jgi:hypothetical protein
MQLRIIMSLMQENFENQMQFLRTSTFSATHPPSGLITTKGTPTATREASSRFRRSAKNLINSSGVRFGLAKRLLDSIDE